MNKVEEFFDNLASSWNKNECHTQEEKINLLKKVNLKKGDKVIDIACGTGVVTGLIHEYTNEDVIGIDISQNMINIALEKYKNDKWAKFIKKDLYDVNDKFDVAIIYNAYPHFLDVDKFVNKLNDILNENGTFAILHSLSRKELLSHHKAKANNVSRDIEECYIESEHFKKYFNIILATENDNSYIIIGKKK